MQLDSLTTDDADSLPEAGGTMSEVTEQNHHAVSDIVSADVLRRIQNNEGVAVEMEVIRAAVQLDPGYAWSWHCNLAVSFKDEGVPHAQANRGAARFMQLLFGLDTSKNEHFAATQAA